MMGGRKLVLARALLGEFWPWLALLLFLSWAILGFVSN